MSEKSTEPIKSAESAKPNESNESNESAESAKPNESAESAKPNESNEPNESAESAKPNESNEPNESAESAKPNESNEPNESAESTKPNESAESTKPNESNESTQSAESTKSVPPSREAVKESSTDQKQGSKKKSKAKIYVGRRKTSVARIRLVSGSGEFHINRRSLENYFPVLHLQQKVKTPLLLLKQEKKYNTFVNVKGGGFRGQAEAISLGIARALCENDPASQKELRGHGLLTRDPRMVERKKYGLHKARRAPQFSKR